MAIARRISKRKSAIIAAGGRCCGIRHLPPDRRLVGGQPGLSFPGRETRLRETESASCVRPADSEPQFGRLAANCKFAIVIGNGSPIENCVKGAGFLLLFVAVDFGLVSSIAELNSRRCRGYSTCQYFQFNFCELQFVSCCDPCLKGGLLLSSADVAPKSGNGKQNAGENLISGLQGQRELRTSSATVRGRGPV